VPAEELGWNLTPGSDGLSGPSNVEKNQPEMRSKGLVEFSTMFNGSTGYSFQILTLKQGQC
jgi:hypothetical protein